MRILENVPNTDPADSDYPKGRIRNKNTGIPVDGTPVIEEVYGDMIQFFQKLVDFAGITENTLPDNTTNGYQLLEALEYWIRTLTASETQKGVVEKANTAETEGGTADKFIDAEHLQALTATETRKGIVEKATTAEAQAGTADKFLDGARLQDVTATTSRKGIVEKATGAEVQSATAEKYLDAENVRQLIATETRPGIQENATTTEAQALTSDSKTITPAKLADVNGGLLVKEVNIGDWNMNWSASGSQFKKVAHGLADETKIRDISVMIIPDSGSGGTYKKLASMPGGGINMNGGTSTIDSTDIRLEQPSAGGAFNNSNYDSTGFNRGYVTIWYKA